MCGVSELLVNAKPHNKIEDLFWKMKALVGPLDRDTVAKTCKRFRSRIEGCRQHWLCHFIEQLVFQYIPPIIFFTSIKSDDFQLRAGLFSKNIFKILEFSLPPYIYVNIIHASINFSAFMDLCLKNVRTSLDLWFANVSAFVDLKLKKYQCFMKTQGFIKTQRCRKKLPAS